MSEPTFKRDEFIDTPGIVGARWWQEGLAHANPVGRRRALQALLIGGGLVALGVMVSKAETCASSSDFTTASKNALEMQKEYGWNFGAATEYPTFDGTTIQPFKPELVPQLATDLAPSQAALRPYFVPTLLQSLVAAPRSVVTGDPAPFIPLTDAVRPIRTSAMDVAYLCGMALASLFDKSVSGIAVIVDLPGPESVAFAAGAASVFDPVFAVDNWPHPRGVVPAHLTLAASLYYQPLFAKVAASRQAGSPTPIPAMFVLDRNRLAPYTDESSQFDNRHLARLPTAAKLKELGITHLLYVVPKDTDTPELDDLNDDFVHDLAAGVTAKLLGATSFGPDITNPSSATIYYYGQSAASHDAFWADYPWITPASNGVHPPNVSMLGRDYVPRVRTTVFSGQSPTGTAARTGPSNFGMVPVVIAAATGAVLGARLSRSGSWNRSSGGWGG